MLRHEHQVDEEHDGDRQLQPDQQPDDRELPPQAAQPLAPARHRVRHEHRRDAQRRQHLDRAHERVAAVHGAGDAGDRSRRQEGEGERGPHGENR